MPNTGERREIKRYTNAKENETVQEAKKLVSKTKQRSAKSAGEEVSREQRNAHAPKASVADDGDPNGKPSGKA